MDISIELISLRDASKISGYHQDYLSFLIRKGSIKGHRIGHMWLISKKELENFLKQKEISKNTSSNTQPSFFQNIAKALFAVFFVMVFVFTAISIFDVNRSNIKIADNAIYSNDF